ncbi:MAG TPA: cation:proton antiporter, partial [Gemmatimonadales bacterium]|nr:cation:proton antiporter [Gemmatimonadales bacterium]
MRRYRFLLPLVAVALLTGAGGDPVAPVVAHLAVILLSAKVGGDLAVRAGQPAVLGELVAGVVMGNVALVGYDGFEAIKQDVTVDQLARLGVLILLFEVGLEATVRQMLAVGGTSLSVAVLGVVAPMGLGWLVGAWLLPDHSLFVHAFLGATLCATSVGITARVLQDLSRSQSREARVILGAAVIDDVLGLMVLSIVTGAISAADTGRTMTFGAVGGLVVKAGAFLVGAMALGVALAPRLFKLASRLRARGALLALGLAICFLLSWLADVIGLAPIVGAFAAGLILEDVHFKSFRDRGERGLEDLIHPIASFLVPVFFVLMGMHTEVASFARPEVLGLAAALTVAAIIGK